MSSVELSDNKHLIHTINGTEDTDKVLELCRELINDRGRAIFTHMGLYDFSKISDFLIAIKNTNPKVDILHIYNTLESDIQKIALEITENSGPEIERFIIDNGINSK